jgi:hypothetical protein
MRTECKLLSKKMTAATLNVGTTPCVANKPDGSGCRIVAKYLRGAFVVDVATCRASVRKAFEAVARFEDKAMPPLCHLARQLHAYANKRNVDTLGEDEVVLMVHHGGLLTISPHPPILPIAATIGFYTVPILRETALRMQNQNKIGVVRNSDLRVKHSARKSHFENLGIAEGIRQRIAMRAGAWPK